ncbi:hypothetical protein [Mycobacterium sp. AZCC_0083]|uniref:hypothetical protein n=1 Tax=Mycobacterium sp. AZCC_0083 TaxID=2735882 RepID=UPI00160B75B9|nr:hypothetical protein [Mycobacterium sp. AZCC_0083]MBB5167174.1 hypothetical protein [Mycobacterium sp. AZCC_0083]
MSTPTLPRTDFDTDIMSAVDGAFKELDCCSQRKEQLACGGDIAGYQEYHDCIQGWLCKTHWDQALQFLPVWKERIRTNGSMGCTHCLNRFDDIRKLVRLTSV